MKNSINFLIFCIISTIVGFMCGASSTSNSLTWFGLCLVFVFCIAYVYAITSKLYNDVGYKNPMNQSMFESDDDDSDEETKDNNEQTETKQTK